MNDETMSTLREELARQDAAWADAMERLEAFAAAGVPIPEEVGDALEAFEEVHAAPPSNNTLSMMGALRA